MSKKKLLSVAFLLLLGGAAIKSYGQGQPVNMEVKKVDDSPIHHGFPKNPIEIPAVYQEDHLIILGDNHPEYELCLIDSNSMVAYTIMVPANTTQVVLPSWLSGQYELQLILGNLCFYGYIFLE